MKCGLRGALLILIVFVLAVFGIAFNSKLSSQRDETLKLTEIVAWIKTQKLKPGIYKDLLPPGFIKPAKYYSDPVLIARVSDTHALALLWKSHLDWHFNYHGYIYVEPQFPVQLGQDSYKRKTLGIDFGEEEPYVVKKISNQIYFVCHDSW